MEEIILHNAKFSFGQTDLGAFINNNKHFLSNNTDKCSNLRDVENSKKIWNKKRKKLKIKNLTSNCDNDIKENKNKIIINVKIDENENIYVNKDTSPGNNNHSPIKKTSRNKKAKKIFIDIASEENHPNTTNNVLNDNNDNDHNSINKNTNKGVTYKDPIDITDKFSTKYIDNYISKFFDEIGSTYIKYLTTDFYVLIYKQINKGIENINNILRNIFISTCKCRFKEFTISDWGNLVILTNLLYGNTKNIENFIDMITCNCPKNSIYDKVGKIINTFYKNEKYVTKVNNNLNINDNVCTVYHTTPTNINNTNINNNNDDYNTTIGDNINNNANNVDNIDNSREEIIGNNRKTLVKLKIGNEILIIYDNFDIGGVSFAKKYINPIHRSIFRKINKIDNLKKDVLKELLMDYTNKGVYLYVPVITNQYYTGKKYGMNEMLNNNIHSEMNHFTLFEIKLLYGDKYKCKINYYDSMFNILNIQQVDKYILMCKWLLNIIFGSNKHVKISKYAMCHQTDGHSCGWFVCYYTTVLTRFRPHKTTIFNGFNNIQFTNFKKTMIDLIENGQIN